MQSSGSTPEDSGTQERSLKRAWERPALTKLPPLTELTLQSLGGGIPGGGIPPGAPGTVF